LGKVGSILSTKKDEKLWARIFTPWKTCVYFSSEFESCKRISKGYRYKVLMMALVGRMSVPSLERS